MSPIKEEPVEMTESGGQWKRKKTRIECAHENQTQTDFKKEQLATMLIQLKSQEDAKKGMSLG